MRNGRDRWSETHKVRLPKVALSKIPIDSVQNYREPCGMRTVLSFRFLCGSVLKFMHCAGFLLLCTTTFAPRTIENLCVHKLPLPHENLKLNSDDEQSSELRCSRNRSSESESFVLIQ